MRPPKISDQSQPSEDLLTYGPLVLDRGKRILTGPLGWCTLKGHEMAIMEVLMQPRMIPLPDLLRVAFPLAEQQPRQPQHALSVRLARLRTVLEQVGVGGDALRCHPSEGYGLGLSGSPVRTYSGTRIRVLDKLLATHPDREMVAALDA